MPIKFVKWPIKGSTGIETLGHDFCIPHMVLNSWSFFLVHQMLVKKMCIDNIRFILRWEKLKSEMLIGIQRYITISPSHSKAKSQANLLSCDKRDPRNIWQPGNNALFVFWCDSGVFQNWNLHLTVVQTSESMVAGMMLPLTTSKGMPVEGNRRRGTTQPSKQFLSLS